MVSEDFVQELKERNDLESVAASYLTLKRRGRTLTALCPFHSEGTPSFHIYPESQSFYCFGCGAGGDVITFVRRIENLEYGEALRFLAQRAGMSMPEDVRDDESARLKVRILEMNRAAARFFFRSLTNPAGREGLDYLRGRGLSDKTIKRFGLGYAPDSWDAVSGYLRGQGYREDELIAAALASQRKSGGCYDAFRHRVMFPIIDLRGNVIGFGGRALDDKGPKYLNSGDTPVFKKSRNLFALNFAKATREPDLILAEGYMDVIAIHQAGIDNAVATLGTALTPEQARLISQYTQEVKISYDSDEAGQKATRRAVELFGQAGVKVRIVSIPDAKDPDEFIKKFGVQRFRIVLDGSANATEFSINRLKAGHDCSTADGKMGFLKEFASVMADVYSPIERDVYISKTAQEMEVSKDALVLQVNSIITQRQKAKRKKEANDLKIFAAGEKGRQYTDSERERQRRDNLRYAVAEDRLLAMLIKNPDFYEYIAQRLKPEQLVTAANREIYTVLCGRLRQSLPVDITSLSMYLDMENLAHVSGLLASAAGFRFTREEADGYIRTILEHETEKSSQEVAQMSDEELKSYISSIASKKK